MAWLLGACLGAHAQPARKLADWYPHRLTPTAPERFAGPFRAESAAFFIVHHGGPLTVTVTAGRPPDDPVVREDGSRVRRALFWQAYDADERLAQMDYWQADRNTDLTYRRAVPFGDAPAGIYQWRYAKAPGDPTVIDLELEPPCAFGVMPVRTRFQDVTEAWVYVPPGTHRVSVPTYACKATVTDEGGRVLLRTGEPNAAREAEISGSEVLRVQVAMDWAGGAFNLVGIPPIFCPDPLTARNIRGSLEAAPDGTPLAHRFQLRLWDWLRALQPADLEVAPVDLTELEAEWVKDPRNVGLLGMSGGFNHVAKILRDQDLDPASPTYGLGTNTAWLGPAYVIDAPFNPYRRNQAVRNRILLEEFTHFLKLDENGTFNPNHWDHYFGVDGLGYRQRIFQFGTVAPHIDPSLRDLWFEAASSVLNRAGMTRVSAENQTSHWLLDLWLLGEASGHGVYQRMARDFAIGLCEPEYNPFMRTGYQQEAYGPDATYQGLAACQQAIYFKYSRDETVRRALQRIYDLFNHTVAPEPDGTMRGASNFSHRTSGSWVQRQYNGGINLMADELPEAGVWVAGLPNEGLVADPAAEIGRRLRFGWDDAWYERNMRWLSTYAYHPWLGFFHEYTFPRGTLQRGTWPAQAHEPFTRNVNGEFLFVRRPGYYAAFYTGRTAHDWKRASYPPVPLVKGWEDRDGVLVPTNGDAAKASWRPTQGLCLLWTPAWGNVLLGKCWNAYTAQLVRADLPDGRIAWPDYWQFEHALDPGTGELRMAWGMADLPVRIERRIAFNDGTLRQELRCTATADTATERIVEQFPVLLKDGMRLEFLGPETWGPTPMGLCRAIRLTSAGAARNGATIRFDQPVTLRQGPRSNLHEQTILCLEVILGGNLAAGQAVTCAYTVGPEAD